VHIIGVGLDNEDGHKRLTKAESFTVVGGSEETHERATETLIKTVEDLSARGKTIDEVDPRQLSDIIQKHSS
jgi:hypothetical protein